MVPAEEESIDATSMAAAADAAAVGGKDRGRELEVERREVGKARRGAVRKELTLTSRGFGI